MKARLATLAVVTAFALAFATSAAANPLQADPAKTTMMKAPVKKKKSRGKSKAMRGIPTGVQACLDHLIQMASTEPMTAYQGHPEEIVNNGLLWNDPKSKCYIGDANRLKVADMATAWRQKNADKVKSLLQELKSAAP
jgi:hypothetical protein